MLGFNLKNIEKARKTRSDKKVRVNPYLDQDVHDKLAKLAISCEMSKTKLAEKLITMCVNNPDVVMHYQNLYNKDDQYAVKMIIENGKVSY